MTQGIIADIVQDQENTYILVAKPDVAQNIVLPMPNEAFKLWKGEKIELIGEAVSIDEERHIIYPTES